MTTRLSPVYCCHNQLYINSDINQTKIIDNAIIPTELVALVSTTMTKTMIKDLENYLYNDIITNGQDSLAKKILHLAIRLKQSFEYTIQRKCYCKNTINWSNKYANNYLTSEEQYNLYIYLFNINSSLPPIYPMTTYNSLFRIILNAAINSLKKIKNIKLLFHRGV